MQMLYKLLKDKYPLSILKSTLFHKIIQMTIIVWIVVSTLFLFVYKTEYSFVYISAFVLLGMLFSALIPSYYAKQKKYKIYFDTLEGAFETMPYGLNKEFAKGLDLVVAFEISGEEEHQVHFIIKDEKCVYKKSIPPSTTLLIKADARLWLDIINAKKDSVKAYLNKDFEMQGDASVMLIFNDLFDKSAKLEKINDRKQDYTYKTFKDKQIRNIIVFDGGARTKKLSKTTLMVDKFVEGAKSAGANVEEFKLSTLNIEQCDGCYMCWTKTPGECVHKDSMTELREKYRSADLVVFASPLYIFNVTGIMKTFMDRLLPILQPYMLLDEKDGHITHPDRYPQKGEQGFVVFSASGFPDVDNNFDGLKGMYRAWDSHNENSHLMGEFFLPAAEMLPQPVYKSRKDLVEKACFEAGVQVVKESKIDYTYMSDVSNPRVSSKTFQHQADSFWERLDGKKSYLREVVKLK